MIITALLVAISANAASAAIGNFPGVQDDFPINEQIILEDWVPHIIRDDSSYDIAFNSIVSTDNERLDRIINANRDRIQDSLDKAHDKAPDGPVICG